ncbi:unnamed protein product [Anisakis simplex]|uniref:Putative tbp-1 interacting protein (inferred by orthology to a S. mansoni protein) n=1 Tax=Anisakis simplex TaxID=6269 RepID=A0A0M3JWN8_ANISI|nr:unnamed protein product [Anisakis simplex]
MKVIPEYMIAQNRPYGASDVYTNLHQEFGKTVNSLADFILLKTISFLSVKRLLENKEIYEYRKMDQNRVHISKVKSLEAQLTTPQLAEAIERLEAELSGMEKRKSELEGNQDSMSADEKKKAEQSVDYYEKLMRQRKRCAEDMIAAISDNYPKKMNILLVACIFFDFILLMELGEMLLVDE